MSTYPGTFCTIGNDANGNVCDLINNDGALLAHYEYSAYGAVIVSSGVEAENNNFRFSSKYWDVETVLGYWGYRWFNGVAWLSRDTIWEQGGLNLYGFVGQNPIGKQDKLGLQATLPNYLDTKGCIGDDGLWYRYGTWQVVKKRPCGRKCNVTEEGWSLWHMWCNDQDGNASGTGRQLCEYNHVIGDMWIAQWSKTIIWDVEPQLKKCDAGPCASKICCNDNGFYWK